ncbi:MAG: hypothetical protein ACE5HQ_00320 [Gemmatimonadota bacterium]
MTKHFRDDQGRRWKAWLASREVFWPEPDGPTIEQGSESILFVCFSDPRQPQRRARVPSGSFESLSSDDLKDRFLKAVVDPAIR